MLNRRKIEIFKAIVEEFIATAEPVGSKKLSDKYQLPYSTATIRNEMNDLEQMGLLEKTHTSSGRVPSTNGYRYYVEHIMEKHLDDEFAVAVRSILEDSRLRIEDVVKQSCDILSQMTNMTSIVLGPEANTQRLEHIKLFPVDARSAVAVFITDSGHTENKVFNFEKEVSLKDIESCCDIMNDRLKGTFIRDVVDKMQSIRPLIERSVERHEMLFNAFVNAFIRFASDNVYFSGQNNMLYQPDFADVEKLKKLMAMMEDHQVLRDIGEGRGELILKTSENSQLVWLEDVAVVSSKFKMDQEEGQLMLVGPSRMAYGQVVSLIDYLAKCIEEIFDKGERNE
jgi:heat shock gene repressor HrcA